MAKPQEVFELFDVDDSGSIDAAIFPLAFRACGFALTAEEMAKVEGAAVQGGRVTLAARENDALAAFAVFDKRDNGTVSAPEWRHVVTSIGDKLNDEEADYMIGDAQPDKDGYIDYKRFVAKIK